jgi:hypothetical protein
VIMGVLGASIRASDDGTDLPHHESRHDCSQLHHSWVTGRPTFVFFTTTNLEVQRLHNGSTTHFSTIGSCGECPGNKKGSRREENDTEILW